MPRTALLALLCAATPAQAATLVVRAEGIRALEGDIRVAVCQRSFDEAGCKVGAIRGAAAPAEDFRFEGIAPGRYAVAVFHDVNGNGELDRNMLGMPGEPYGFSNEVGRVAPPRLDAALIEVGEGDTTVVVQLRRMLGGS